MTGDIYNMNENAKFTLTNNGNDASSIIVNLDSKDADAFTNYFLKETEGGKRFCLGAFMQMQFLLLAVSFPFMFVNELGLFVLIVLEIQLLFRTKGHPFIHPGKMKHNTLSHHMLIPSADVNRRIITLCKKGIEYRVKQMFFYYSASSVQRVVETKDYFYIFVIASFPIVVPKRSFEAADKYEEFRDKLKSTFLFEISGKGVRPIK